MKTPSDTHGSATRRSLWRRMHRARAWFDQHPALRLARKVIVSFVSAVLILTGLITGPFLPGPQSVIVVFGLLLLATEFIWAHRVIRRGQVAVHRAARRLSGHRLKRMWRWKKRVKRRIGMPEPSSAGL